MVNDRSTPLRLGFIGLSAKGQWAAKSHLPALRDSADYTISAILNSTPASTSEAAAHYNLPSSTARYQDLNSLVSDKEIDAIAVSVKVPHHATYVRAALQASKHVFCEWPLARSLAEAEELSNLARESGVRTMIGLQARQSPAIRTARAMVQNGELGTILGTTMLGAGGLFVGGKTTETYKYLADIDTGANMLTIPCMHAVDALCWTLGEWTDVRAVLANLQPKLQYVDDAGEETGAIVKKTSHDYVAITGTLQNGGGVASVVYEAGTSQARKDFYWEITGTEGTLVLEGIVGHVQMVEPTLVLIKPDGTRVDDLGLPKPENVGLDHNVGEAWKAFAGHGEGEVTTFEDALVRHRMIEAVYKSAKTGSKEVYV